MSNWICRNTTCLILLAAFQGLIVFPNLGIQYFFLIDLKLTPGQLSIFNGIINYVWVLKALFGFVVDSLYFYGYRRKPNLLLFSIICTIGWFVMGFYVDSLATAVITKLAINICLGFINTITEAVMVEMSIDSNKEQAKEIVNSIVAQQTSDRESQTKNEELENDDDEKDQNICLSDGDNSKKYSSALLPNNKDQGVSNKIELTQDIDTLS